MKSTTRTLFERAFRVWQSFFFDPRRLAMMAPELFWFGKSWRRYRRLANDAGVTTPVIKDPVFFQRTSQSSFDAHYVYQAAWAIRRITSLPKGKTPHVDVSSNVTFVAALSSVTPVTFYEFRPPAIQLKDLVLQQADLLQLPIPTGSCHSVSCLHVIEHVGLGRYGDALDPRGSERALKELGRCLAVGGRLFLSTPIGQRRVCFNKHRVFAPEDIPLALGSHWRVAEFSAVGDDGQLHEFAHMNDFVDASYACGLYVLEKIA